MVEPDGERSYTLRPGWVTAWTASVLPLVIAVPALAGAVVSLLQILTIRHPNLDWATAVASDAKAVALGEMIYRDPAEGYSGMLYAPLFPMVLAPFYRAYWWDGWPILVVMASVAGMLGLIGFLTTNRNVQHAGDRIGEVLAGVGVAGLAWWVMSTSSGNLLYEGRSDHFAWLLALLGLFVVARLAGGQSTRVWPSVVLLTAALWTKQTTIGAAAAAAVGLTWWMVRGGVDRRTWVRFVVAMTVTNSALLVVGLVATKGWIWYFLVTMPARHTHDPQLLPYLQDFRGQIALAVVLAWVVGVGVLAEELRKWRRRVIDGVRPLPPMRSLFRRLLQQGRRPSWRAALVVLLVLFVVLSLPPTFAARRKQGGAQNAYLGIEWALLFLFAIGARRARQSFVGAVALISTVGFVVATVHWSPLHRKATTEWAIPVTPIHRTADFRPHAPEFVNYAKNHRLYLSSTGDLSAPSLHEIWPMQHNIVDLLAGGEPPRALVDALLRRHFDAVSPFDVVADPYASANGRREENFLWKMNRVIASGYEPGVAGVPTGTLGRRAEGPLEPWLRTCFAPFRVGGTEWVIRRGGGLWCRPSPTVVALEETPAPESELLSSRPVKPSGELLVELRGGAGSVLVEYGAAHSPVRVRLEMHAPGAVRATVSRAGVRDRVVDVNSLPSRPFAIRLSFGRTGEADGRLSVPTAGDAGPFQVVATQDSRALLDFAAFRSVR